MAESVLRKKVNDQGLVVNIESAGTGNWHVGHDPDPRTIRTLAQHQITEYSKARQFRSSDFDSFDFIIAMDEENKRTLDRWENAKLEKVTLMMDWSPGEFGVPVPDPYYGGPEDFELVYQMVDRATNGLIEQLKKKTPGD